MKQQYIIYRIMHPINKTTVYIGKTCKSITKRLNEHIYASKTKTKKNLFHAWLTSICKLNLRPEIEIIELCSNLNVNERERYWISYYKKINPRLKNSQPGGDGNSKGYNFKKRHVPPSGIMPKHLIKFIGHLRGVKKSKKSCIKRSEILKYKYSNNLLTHYSKKIVAKNTKTNVEICFKSLKDASEYYNININLIVSHCKKKRKLTDRGLTFKYITDSDYAELKTTGVGIKRKVYLYDMTNNILTFDSITQCARFFSIKRDTVYRWCHEQKISIGYRWSFYEIK